MKTIEGKLTAQGLKFAVVVSRFNDFLTAKLLEGAIDALKRHGADEKDINIFKVPGAFEMPVVCEKLVSQQDIPLTRSHPSTPLRASKGRGVVEIPERKYDAIICLGTIIRGDSPHFEFVAGEAAKGISHVSVKNKFPIVFGIITADNLEQAIERAGTKHGNKGSEAARTAIEMANLFKNL